MKIKEEIFVFLFLFHFWLLSGSYKPKIECPPSFFEHKLIERWLRKCSQRPAGDFWILFPLPARSYLHSLGLEKMCPENEREMGSQASFPFSELTNATGKKITNSGQKIPSAPFLKIREILWEGKVLRVFSSGRWVPRNQGWLNFWETRLVTVRKSLHRSCWTELTCQGILLP